MDKAEEFKTTCAAMGGKYEEEDGLLEPDVGGLHLDTYQTRKQWCAFKNFKPLNANMTIFNAPNTFNINVGANREEFLDLYDDAEEHLKTFLETPPCPKMCFIAGGIRLPLGKYCVAKHPTAGLRLTVEID